MIITILLYVLAVEVLDALTGIYHALTDAGYNAPGIVKQFRDHHDSNTMSTWDWQPLVYGSLPAMAIAFAIGSHFLFVLAIINAVAQVPHYYAHHPPAWGPIRWAQRWGLILSPEQHRLHHSGDFDRNFCVFTGHNDWWLNVLTRRSKA